MSLTYRSATLDDLTGCLDTLCDHYGNDPDVIALLPAVWRALLSSGALLATVLEDRSLPPGARLLTLGATVCVTDAFAAQAKSGDAPHVSAQIVRQIQRGDSPVLDLEAMRRANRAEGLNLCVLHNDHRSPLRNIHPDPGVREKHIEAFFHFHRGYRIKDFLQEVYGEAAKNWMLTSGMKMRNDYALYYARRTASQPRPEDRPYLIGLTRQEAQDLSGSRAFPIFVYTPARLGFTEREQELLLRAVAGETDEQLAGSLCLSTSAVKKRWFALYDRVADADPELLAAGADPAGESRRGAERRRHLLNYLREHPEELWPINAAGRHGHGQ